jgi:hypothetical protein
MGGWRKLHNEELRDIYCLPIDQVEDDDMN